MLRFLHAACGGNHKSRSTRVFSTTDWEEVRMDQDPGVNPDIVSSLLDMSAIKDSSFDAVFTAHSLERLYPHEVGQALSNIFRVLKSDGYLVLTCSDIQAACALVADDKLLEPAYESPAGPVSPLDILYGFRPALASGLVHQACKCGFTSRALLGTLSQAGFGSMWAARNPQTFTLVALACKQKLPNEAIRKMASSHFGER